MPITQNLDDDENRDAVWHVFRLHEPTFDDITRGVLIGVAWCLVLWAPMLLDVLSKH